jgi:tRNA (cmo5U34)-methyltransferase
MKNNTDTIYAHTDVAKGSFVFDDRVAGVFDDMISRSVPGYRDIVAMTGILTNRYAKPRTNAYDLGCSLGASALAMRQNLPCKSCRVVAVDNSGAMTEKAKMRFADAGYADIELRTEDIALTDMHDASVVTLNFVLQFFPVKKRLWLLKKICSATVNGGILVLSEKIRSSDEADESFLTESHHTFKHLNGYSASEIARKRAALEKVLVSDTFSTHRMRLLRAGYSQVHLWFRCFNFVSIVAIK